MIVGLTGVMGSGKTTILKMFEELGAAVYIADVEAKKMMSTSFELKDKIIAAFGKDSYDNGKLNTKYLSNIVFKNPNKLELLNSFVHPAIQKDFLEFVSNSTKKYVVFESALLFQTKIQDYCEFKIVVTAPFDIRLDRIMQRDGLSQHAIESRLKHQSSVEDMLLKADFVIENVAIKSTKEEVFRLHKLFLDKS